MFILGTALPAANTLATLYKVPTGRRAVVNVAACNKGSAAIATPRTTPHTQVQALDATTQVMAGVLDEEIDALQQALRRERLRRWLNL